MDHRTVFQKIDELEQRYVQVWEDVCSIESPTDCKAGVDAVGAYISELARERGWEVEVFEQPVSGNVVCITMNPDAPGVPVSLSGHIDTVHAVGSFGSPAVRIEGNKIYGPGTCDCKGGVVAGLLAMDALYSTGFQSRPVRMLLQSDEENGSQFSEKATIGYICEKAKDSCAFLNLEGHSVGEACLIRKGIITFTFTVRGVAAHASRCAVIGSNAIAEAAYKIIELEKLKDAEGLTCNCGVITGGTVANTVPDLCVFHANVRFATKEQLAWVREYVQKIADTVYVKGCSTTVTSTMRVAMELEERNVLLLDKMNRIFSACGLSELKASKRTGGSDAADVTVYGIPCVDSIGVRGDKIHSTGEFGYIDSLTEAARRLAVLIADLA